jgi:succinoglycan biosynthesis protein ExoV
MNLYAFKAPQGNFGDDLNAWLWPRVFGADIDLSPQTTFVGIGSILDRRLEQLRGPMIVFGSGVRATHTLPGLTENVHIRFVRGPISATALGQGTTAITDPAILVGAFAPAAPRQCGRTIGFMPHYHSLRAVDWNSVCTRLGFVFIDPRGSVDHTIAALRGCGRVITEAMHGAIVADALRIPWHRVSLLAWRKEGFEVSSLKWLDWGLSAGIDVTPTHLGLDFPQASGWIMRAAGLPAQQLARRRLTGCLASLRTNATYQLSSDGTYRDLLAQLNEQVRRMRSWLRGDHDG